MNDPIRPPRLHELDWLRVIAILILLGYHVGMIFVTWGWHIQSRDTSVVLQTIMAWLHYWRMPLLLFISGAGTFFALRHRTASRFVGERSRRLIIPLVFGMLVVVPPQIWFERIGEYPGYLAFWLTVFELVPYPEGGSLSWHHLWFILYLFLYSAIALPLFLYLRGDHATALFDRLERLVKRTGFTLFVIPLIAGRAILGERFPDETHALIDDWNFFLYYGTFFVFGFLLCRDRRVWEKIGDLRRINLIIALALLIPFYWAFFRHYGQSRAIELTYDIAAIAIAWFTLLTAVGYGQRLLRRGGPFLSFANEVAYPFYIVHQTVIIAIGFHVIRANDGVWLNFVMINVASFLVSMAIVHFMIRPFALTRLLFGMKPAAMRGLTMRQRLALGKQPDTVPLAVS